MKVYYAHPISTYSTKIEAKDHSTLIDLGFEILCPNTPEIDQKYRDSGRNMDIFKDLVQGCDLIAFRSFPDGSISSGVAMEIEWAREHGMHVIELPSGFERRALNRRETKEYLEELGYR